MSNATSGGQVQSQPEPASPDFDEKTWKESKNKIVPAVLVGTTLEWYDVMIYAQAAALIFPLLFFPEVDPAMGTIAAFATYGVGYLARPFGAVVFGYVGDRFGRRTALVLTLLLMGIATTLIGVLPTYAAVGVAAPIMLAVLRLLQGLAAGAEYAGSFVMIGELAPPKTRGFWTSIPGIGIYAGVVLSALVASVTFTGSDEWVMTVGWRIPFLVSILLVIVGFVLRFRVAESPVFKDLEVAKTERSIPVVEVFRKMPVRVLLAVILTAPIGWSSYVALTYSISYASNIGYDRGDAILGTLVGSVVAIVLVPVVGAMTDRFGRRPIYMLVSVLGMGVAFPFFILLNTGSVMGLYIGHVIIAVGVYTVTGAQAAYLAELFPAEFRFTGVAISRELSTALLAAPAPALAAALYLWSGGPWWTAGIMVAVSLLCLLAVIALPETRGIDMAYTSDDMDGRMKAGPESQEAAMAPRASLTESSP